MQELYDEERRHLALNNGHEVDAVPEDADEVMVRRGDDGGYILGLARPLLGLEEVVAHRAADHAFPVLLQEDVPRGVDQEQAVDHPKGRGLGHGARTGQ